jgi:hypothetical protein
MQQHEQLSLGMRSAARRESAKLVESLNQDSLYDQYILKLGEFFGIPHAFQPDTPGKLSPQSLVFFSDVERRRQELQRSGIPRRQQFRRGSLSSSSEGENTEPFMFDDLSDAPSSSSSPSSYHSPTKLTKYDMVAYPESAAPVALLYNPSQSKSSTQHRTRRVLGVLSPFPGIDRPEKNTIVFEDAAHLPAPALAAPPMPPQEDFDKNTHPFIPLMPDSGFDAPQTNFFDLQQPIWKETTPTPSSAKPQKRFSSATPRVSTIAAGPNVVVQGSRSRTTSRSNVNSMFFGNVTTQPSMAASLHPSLVFNVGEIFLGGLPPRRMVEVCVLDPIKAHCHAVSSTIMSIMVRSCRLSDHLSSARAFFTQEHGLLFSMLQQTLFRDLRDSSSATSLRGRKKYGASALNMLFQQCLDLNGGSESIFGADLVSLRIAPSARVEATATKDDDGLLLSPRDAVAESHSIKSIYESDRIRLHYAVEWPLNFFINSKTMAEYNKVFSLLTRLGRAEFELQRLITSLSAHAKRQRALGDSLSDSIHRMQLLRMRLLHFVQTLRSYVANRVLQTAWDGFEDRLVNAKDLEDMLNIHNEFLRTLLDRCMLTDNFSAIRSRIDSILDLALLFGSTFDVEAIVRSAESGNDQATSHLGKAYITIDSELGKSVTFLLNVLGTIAEQRHVPHCTPVSFSGSLQLRLTSFVQWRIFSSD